MRWVCPNCCGIYFNNGGYCTRCGMLQSFTFCEPCDDAPAPEPSQEFDVKPWLITLKEIRSLPETMER